MVKSKRERIMIYEDNQKLTPSIALFKYCFNSSYINYCNEVGEDKEVKDDPINVDVVNNDVVSTIIELQNKYEHAKHRTGVLVFASYKNPGGGYINGASGQEEDLCRCSTLYPNLNGIRYECGSFYNRENPFDYIDKENDMMIVLKAISLIRDSDYNLLNRPLNDPYQFTALISDAPNINGMKSSMKNRDDMVVANMEVYAYKAYRRRVKMVLDAARFYNNKYLIVGAWGCGVFGCDYQLTAEIWKTEIDNYPNVFENIIFAITDKDQYRVYMQVFFGFDVERVQAFGFDVEDMKMHRQMKRNIGYLIKRELESKGDIDQP